MKRIVWLLIFGFLLTGCGKQTQPLHRVVTKVQVEYIRGEGTLHRTYINTTSIQSVLTYLRILRPFGPVIPEKEADTTCRITLTYSSGPNSVFLQHGDHYLQRDDQDWTRIDNSHATLLYPLLLLLPSEE